MGEEKAGKGFVIKDRRGEDQEGATVKEGIDHPSPGTAGSSFGENSRSSAKETPESTGKERLKDEYLAEVTFYNFILTVSSQALFHFGDFPDPETNQTERNLPAAQHAIDLLTMLKTKTRGNLDEREAKLLEGVLFELQMRFVREKAKG
jgi:hypothetical protein